jgi:hypothetical protein
MDSPSPEVCRELLSLHALLGYSQLPAEQREVFRTQLCDLLAKHGLKWSDWREFFAAQAIAPSQPLPPVDDAKTKSPWAKRCQTICNLHARMASNDDEARAAYKKLWAEVAKQKFDWSSDLPAILVARWAYDNPTVAGSTAQSGKHLSAAAAGTA